jgi:hypothetical protein
MASGQEESDAQEPYWACLGKRVGEEREKGLKEKRQGQRTSKVVA